MTESINFDVFEAAENEYDRAMREALMGELQVVLREQFKRLLEVARRWDGRDPIECAEDTAAGWTRGWALAAIHDAYNEAKSTARILEALETGRAGFEPA